MDEIITHQYSSPCGRITLGSYAGRLCLCDWTDADHHSTVVRRLMRTFGAVLQPGESSVIEAAARQLDEYFSGRRRMFDIPLMTAGTDFQKSVWSRLNGIPSGKTISYRSLACDIGRPQSVRAIANAVGANALSIFIPCHRVVGSDGSLTGYAGGLAAKQFLLGLEQQRLSASESRQEE